MIFFVREYNHLDTIRYFYKLTDTITVDITVNFYAILIIIAIIFVIVIIASINIVGSGLNETGGKGLLRFVSFIIIYIIAGLGTGFYMQSLGGTFLGIWTVITSFVYIMYLASVNIENHL